MKIIRDLLSGGCKISSVIVNLIDRVYTQFKERLRDLCNDQCALRWVGDCCFSDVIYVVAKLFTQCMRPQHVSHVKCLTDFGKGLCHEVDVRFLVLKISAK